MWLKLCLLLIYITVLFILARLLEAIACCETGLLSRRLLDPMTLSVLKLKALLDSRGVSYEGVVEKHELTDLVDHSGQVGEEEMELTSAEVEEDGEVTIFSSGVHFYEQVEDTKDSVWLVQIQTHASTPPLSVQTWKAIRKKVNRFGVRAGVFDCSLDRRYCRQRNWLTSQVVLALPQDFETKSNVAFFFYSGAMRENPLYNWIRDRLNSKVVRITSLHQFQADWLAYQNRFLATEIRAVLFQDSQTIPMCFSALGVKFPGRVRFGTVLTSSAHGREILSKFSWVNSTLDADQTNYIIITPEVIAKYGRRLGENLSFSSMEKYLNSLYPCLNDIFVLSFIVNNMVALFELVVARGNLIKRVRRTAWCWIKYNVLFVMLWLPLMGLFQLPHLDQLPLFGLKVIRMMATTDFAALLRRDYAYFLRNLPLLCTSLSLYAALAACLCHHYKLGEEESEEEEDYWNFAQMRVLQPLLRPSDTIIGPFSRFGSEYIMGEDIFDGPVVPSVNLSYIRDLPTWRYSFQPVHNLPSPSTCSCRCSLEAERELLRDRSNGNATNGMQGETNTSTGTSESHDKLDSCVARQEGKSAITSCSTSTREQSLPFQCCPVCSSFQESSKLSSPSCTRCLDGDVNSATEVRNLEPECPICECACKNTRGTGSANSSQQLNDTDAVAEGAGGEAPLQDQTSCLETEAWHHKGDNCPSRACNSCSNTGSVERAGAKGSFPEGFRASSQCVICLEDYSPGVLLCGLPCRHAFHQDCILRWLKADNHLCPVCRCPSHTAHPSPSPNLHLD